MSFDLEIPEPEEVKAKVEQERCSENRVSAEEIDFDLHWIIHPSEDVNVVPSLLIVVAWRIIVDSYFMEIIGIKVRLFVLHKYGLKR